jgi:hypothetical protein
VNDVSVLTSVPAALTPTSVVVGSPTGGNLGAGTVNAIGLYVNDVAVPTTQAAIGALLWPKTSLETTAGVTVVTDAYPTYPFYDIRRYGFTGNGTTDDSTAWKQLALLVAHGASVYVPPGPTYVASQVTFTVPTNQTAYIFGYGVQLYTNNGSTANAIDGLRFTGGGNCNGLTVLGITYNQIDATATNGFNIYQGSSVKLEDCAVIVSSTVASNAAFAGVSVVADTGGVYGFWNKVINLDVRQPTGYAPAYAAFAILLVGQCNATTIRDCKLSSTNTAVGLIAQTSNPLANGVVIESNAFEGGVDCIQVNGESIALSEIDGLRITNNRAESYTGTFLLLQSLEADSSDCPIFLSGNFFGASVAAYITQSGNATTITVNSLDVAITPSWGATGTNSSLRNNGPFIFQSVASTGGHYDAIQGVVQTSGGGLSLLNSSGSLLGAFRYNGTVAVLSVGTNQVVGPQIGGYGTPTGGSHQASFAAGSITLANLAAAVAQLIVDLKTHGLIAA